MSLFGLFGKKDHAAEAKKLAQRATQKFGHPETRQKALEMLADLGTPEGYACLLQRFEVRVEPGITDDEEKEYVCNRLVESGAPAVDAIKTFILKSSQPTWALRALERLVPQEESVATTLAALEREGAEYTRDPEKKTTLLRYLATVDDDRIAPALVPFLQDPSEDVRAAAVVTIAEHPRDEVREALIAALIRANEEGSERMRRALAEALAKCQFAVKGFTPAVQTALPAGFSLDKEGVVHAK